MKLIDANAVITANLFDDEHEEFLQKRTTVGELVDFCSEEGCPKAVEAIPVVWIEEYIKRVLSFDGYYSSLRALFIHIMLNDWRKEQK